MAFFPGFRKIAYDYGQSSPPRRRAYYESEAVAGMPRRSAAAENWELAELLEQKNFVLAGGTDKIPDITTPASETRGVDTTTQDLLSTVDQHTTLQETPSDGKDETTSESETESQKEPVWLKYSKLVLPHVGLVLLTCTYTLIGASVFYSIERPNEEKTKTVQLEKIFEQRKSFLDLMWNLSKSGLITEQTWKKLGNAHMENVTDELFVSFEKFFLSSQEVRHNKTAEIWTFSTAIFFAVTVVTTIGYGNPVPVTMAGRLICIFFALFGIPLTLVTIADIGKFFSEHLVWLYGKYLNAKHSMVRKLSTKHCPPKHSDANHVCQHCKNLTTPELIEEKKIPATLVLGILVLYTALGGVLMSHLEPWNFFVSFYYSFITMTTVGFGDLMPRRDSYMYLILLYIVIGLAITTMCIDLVGVQYIRKIHYFGRKIQDARSALAVVGGKVVLVSELYANLMQRRSRMGASGDAFIIENLYLTKHLIPYIPRDIRRIKYIDQATDSLSTSTSSMEFHSCKYCHSRFSISHTVTHGQN